MKAFLLVCLLSVFAKSVNAEKSSSKPCCRPETLEGSAKQYYLPSTEPRLDIKFYLDYRNLKYAVEYPSTTFKEIALCDSQSTCLVYDITESKKQCSKYKLVNATLNGFWTQCIPNNATSQGTVRLGSDEKQSSLLLQNWMFLYYGYPFEALVTDIDCYPVVDFMSISPNSLYIQQVYFDTTKSIKDPSVFTPPAYCDQANDMHEDSEYQHKMFASLFSTLK